MTHPRFAFADDAVTRIAARDGSLFADDPLVAADVAAFMGWTDLAEQAASVLPAIEQLVGEVRAEGLTDVVLLGMGGSSLATLVMGAILPGDGPRLHVLDTTSPVTVARALAATDPATTIHLVSSKSGGTIEPNALYAIFRARADESLGREAAGQRFIAITDPGSALERLAAHEGMRACVLAPPAVGGRYSALTVFGLVPTGLLGVDVRRLVESALEVERRFTQGPGDTDLADFIATAHARGIDKLSIVAPPELHVFGLWIEQLVAESLGKMGRGIVPVIETRTLDTVRGDQAIVVLERAGDAPAVLGCAPETPLLTMTLTDPHDIGGWFVLWEYSVALVGLALGVNPFDQPNVAEAKAATNAVLEGSIDAEAPHAVTDGVRLMFGGGLEPPPQPQLDLRVAVRHALQALRPGDYLVLLAYLPDDEAILAPLRDAMALAGRDAGVSACFELGPRYLHSTGQLHKGGPNTGVFVMVTTRDATDIEIPGWPFGLRALHAAQAEGDLTALMAHGRRVLRLDLPDASPVSIAAVVAALHD